MYLNFCHIRDWLKDLEKIDSDLMPKHILSKAKQLKLYSLIGCRLTSFCMVDLHHENIIRHQNEWLAIDPKGIIGDPEFEISAYDILDKKEIDANNDITALLEKRINKLSKIANLNHQRVKSWIFIRLTLSAAWFIQDRGNPDWPLKDSRTFSG